MLSCRNPLLIKSSTLTCGQIFSFSFVFFSLFLLSGLKITEREEDVDGTERSSYNTGSTGEQDLDSGVLWVTGTLIS